MLMQPEVNLVGDYFLVYKGQFFYISLTDNKYCEINKSNILQPLYPVRGTQKPNLFLLETEILVSI